MGIASASQCDETEVLLRPYLNTWTVNGKSCRVLRDRGATIDMVYPDYVTEAQYSGKSSWIRSVIEEGSVCLPVSDVRTSRTFRDVRTELAVSGRLPPDYPNIFSDRSKKLLSE